MEIQEQDVIGTLPEKPKRQRKPRASKHNPNPRPKTPQEEAALARWEALEKAKGSKSREVLYGEGYDAGYMQAADDYAADTVQMNWEKLATWEDVSDHYMVGFETGYYRKLAEIAIY